jgi:D-serine dehydratase
MYSALTGDGDTSADGIAKRMESLFVFMRMKNHVLEGCKTLSVKTVYAILPPVHVKNAK